jgi:hypothetical protein
MRRGQPTEVGDACEVAGRDPDTLNGAASGETPGPRFFLFLLAVMKHRSASVFHFRARRTVRKWVLSTFIRASGRLAHRSMSGDKLLINSRSQEHPGSAWVRAE